MRALRLSAYVVIALVAVLGLAFAGVQTAPGKRLLASLASDLASAPDQKITITGIDGFVPTDLQVARVEIADRTGPWLQVENAQLSWSFASLLPRRLRIDLLSAAGREEGGNAFERWPPTPLRHRSAGIAHRRPPAGGRSRRH